MSWEKESSEAGLAGYTPKQAALAALFYPEFQKVPDPLDPLVKELDVSTK